MQHTEMTYRLGHCAALLALALTACTRGDLADLERFVHAERDTLRAIERLPRLTPYDPPAYSGSGFADPFRPRAPDVKPVPVPDWRVEPLETYPLDSLRMMGTVHQGGVTYAFVRAPDNSVHRVGAGSHVGQNFGSVTGISDSGITLKEHVQDNAGEWTERVSRLQLTE